MIVIVIEIIIGAEVWVHQRRSISQNRANIRTARMTTARYNEQSKYTTKSRLKSEYDKTEPNLDAVKKATNKNLNKGMILAFNKSHKVANYNKNKSQISQLLGSSISSYVFSIVKPQSNNDPHFTKPRSMSDHIQTCDISYGRFNKQTQSIPMLISMTYKTPVFNLEAGAGHTDLNKEQSHVGSVIMNGTLSVQDHTITVNHEYDRIQGSDNE